MNSGIGLASILSCGLGCGLAAGGGAGMPSTIVAMSFCTTGDRERPKYCSFKMPKQANPEISISSTSSCDSHRADEQGVQCTIVVHGQAFIPCQNCTNPMTLTNPSFTRERRFREIRFISTRFEASTDLHEHGCCASDIVNRTTFANPLLPSLTRLTGARDGCMCTDTTYLH